MPPPSWLLIRAHPERHGRTSLRNPAVPWEHGRVRLRLRRTGRPVGAGSRTGSCRAACPRPCRSARKARPPAAVRPNVASVLTRPSIRRPPPPSGTRPGRRARHGTSWRCPARTAAARDLELVAAILQDARNWSPASTPWESQKAGEGRRDGTEASGPDLYDRDLLPVVQLIGLDGHRHVVGVEPHRHAELEVSGDLEAERRRRAER